uniref:Uncharacterized protein n=1 Tax=Eptatretus burgeri TaxID=7764 RepID=A0A8C4Q1W3_EPTBU
MEGTNRRQTRHLLHFVDPGHPLAFLSFLNADRHAAQHCDVILIAGDAKFRAHRCVLAAGSSHFRRILSPQPETSGTASRPAVVHLDAAPGPLEHVLGFLYTASLAVSPSDLATVQSLGRKLGVNFLSELESHAPAGLFPGPTNTSVEGERQDADGFAQESKPQETSQESLTLSDKSLMPGSGQINMKRQNLGGRPVSQPRRSARGTSLERTIARLQQTVQPLVCSARQKRDEKKPNSILRRLDSKGLRTRNRRKPAWLDDTVWSSSSHRSSNFEMMQMPTSSDMWSNEDCSDEDTPSSHPASGLLQNDSDVQQANTNSPAEFDYTNDQIAEQEAPVATGSTSLSCIGMVVHRTNMLRTRRQSLSCYRPGVDPDSPPMRKLVPQDFGPEELPILPLEALPVDDSETRKPLCCSECNRLFYSMAALCRHARDYHDPARPYPCPVCHRRFLSKFKVWTHCQAQHSLFDSAGLFCDPEESYDTTQVNSERCFAQATSTDGVLDDSLRKSDADKEDAFVAKSDNIQTMCTNDKDHKYMRGLFDSPTDNDMKECRQGGASPPHLGSPGLKRKVSSDAIDPNYVEPYSEDIASITEPAITSGELNSGMETEPLCNNKSKEQQMCRVCLRVFRTAFSLWRHKNEGQCCVEILDASPKERDSSLAQNSDTSKSQKLTLVLLKPEVHAVKKRTKQASEDVEDKPSFEAKAESSASSSDGAMGDAGIEPGPTFGSSHVCPKCEVTFKTSYELDRHRELFCPFKPFRCPDCFKAYRTNFRLWSHWQSHHALPVKEVMFSPLSVCVQDISKSC